MAEDDNSMDLNLHVSLPALPHPRSPDHGSNLTLSSPTFQRNYSLSNALHAPESSLLDPLHVADDSPVLEPSLLARLVQLETHASDAQNSTPYAPTSTRPYQPSASPPPAGLLLQRHDEAAASINPCPTDLCMSRRLIDKSMHDIMQSLRNLEASKKDNLHGEGKGTKCLEKKKSASEFECNICFDIANEPVVTPCGHLFCWPCLYQWFTHAIFRECPVCKGEVHETNLTPIYGRGDSDTTAKKVYREDGNSELKLPPRPHAHRIESLGQKFQRSTEMIVVGEHATSQGHIEELHTTIRFGEVPGPSLGLRLNASDPVFIGRLRQWSMQMEERYGSDFRGIHLPTITQPNLQTNSTNSPMDSHDHEPLHWRPTVQSTPTRDPATPPSTAIVITGDSTAIDITAEPNRERSSTSLRRIGRNSNSGSLDAVEGASPSYGSRRLN